MKCYRHPDRDAVAICKHCMKGLCPACAVGGPGGTACSDACAARIASVQEALMRSSASLGLPRQVAWFLMLFLIVTGSGFILWGLFVDSGKVRSLTLGAGVVFALFSLAPYLYLRRHPDIRA